MRGAFVIRLAPETQSDQLSFIGWIEEVDTGREVRFNSTKELLCFLGTCFEEALDSARCQPLSQQKGQCSVGRNEKP